MVDRVLRRRILLLFCIPSCISFIFVGYHVVNESARYEASLPTCRPVCSQTDVDRRPSTVVLTTTNMGFLKMTENMLASIKRTRSCPRTVVIAEDKLSYEGMKSQTHCYRALDVQLTDSGLTTPLKLKVGGRIYNQFVRKRAKYILSFLESNLEVLFVDADNFWVQDPFRDMEGDFDIAAHNEVSPPRQPVFCCGFVYYRPTENTIRLVREWVKLMQTTYRKDPDQKVFNRLVNRELEKNISGLNMKTLNPLHYPDGKLYYRVPGWRDKHFNETKVMHFSYLHGYDSKVVKMKELGWWLV